MDFLSINITTLFVKNSVFTMFIVIVSKWYCVYTGNDVEKNLPGPSGGTQTIKIQGRYLFAQRAKNTQDNL